MSKSYDNQYITSFTTPPYLGGKYYNISYLIKLVCFMVFLLTAFDSVALQNNDAVNGDRVIKADSAVIYFRKSSSGLDTNCDTNGVKLERLKQTIRENIATDTSLIISSLRIIGSASPEGSERYNRLLSEKRASAIYDYLT